VEGSSEAYVDSGRACLDRREGIILTDDFLVGHFDGCDMSNQVSELGWRGMNPV
jgi:hypothetical protein